MGCNSENEKNKSSLITGVVVARKDFVEAHPEAEWTSYRSMKHLLSM